jgi:hypothetical protein
MKQTGDRGGQWIVVLQGQGEEYLCIRYTQFVSVTKAERSAAI